MATSKENMSPITIIFEEVRCSIKFLEKVLCCVLIRVIFDRGGRFFLATFTSLGRSWTCLHTAGAGVVARVAVAEEVVIDLG